MKREQAAAWKNFMENPCWKQLVQISEEIQEASIRDEDSISTSDLTVAAIAEGRGIRKGLKNLFRQADEAAHDA